MITGFDKAQSDYDNAEPPEPTELTRLDVSFVVRIGMDVDLSDYYDADPMSVIINAFMRQEVEGHVTIGGFFRGDKRSPFPAEDIEISDFEAELA